MSLDVVLQHEAARAALVDALSLSHPIGRLLIQYLGLFKPHKRALTMDRVAGLLAELTPLIKAAQIERRGRVWAAPREAWAAAIESLLANRANLTLPLKSHGYLFEVLVGIANKGEAVAEAKQEAQRAQQSGTGTAVERKQETRAAMPAHVRDTLQGLSKKIKGQT